MNQTLQMQVTVYGRFYFKPTARDDKQKRDPEDKDAVCSYWMLLETLCILEYNSYDSVL